MIIFSKLSVRPVTMQCMKRSFIIRIFNKTHQKNSQYLTHQRKFYNSQLASMVFEDDNIEELDSSIKSKRIQIYAENILMIFTYKVLPIFKVKDAREGVQFIKSSLVILFV